MAGKQGQQKKIRKKQSKASIYSKKMDRSLKGFWMRFQLDDPLGDHGKPCKVQVGSKNPVIQLQLCNDQFWGAMRQVLNSRVLKWKILIEMDFTKSNGEVEAKPREIIGISALTNLDDAYQTTIEEMFQDATDKNYLDKYITTRVYQEVLSGQEIKEEDWSQ